MNKLNIIIQTLWINTGILLALTCLCGCMSVGPDYERPVVEIQEAWNPSIMEDLQSGESIPDTWWTILNDTVLDELIRHALAGNFDLKIALARIEEVGALRGMAKSEWFPQVTGVGNASRTRISEGVTPELPDEADRTGESYQLGLSVGWELDFWGRVRRSVESARASFEATTEDYRDALVSLQAGIASTYIDVRSLQTRLRDAEKNARAQRKTLGLTTNRFNAGLSSKLDIRQAELNLAETESLMPSLHIQLERAMNRLGVLSGQRPAALWLGLSDAGEIPSPPKAVLVGVPVDLLRRRPDVRAAERSLAAQHARIGVAKADFFPSLTLPGTFVLEALDTGDLINSGSLAYGFGPSLRWNLFAGGAILNKVRAEKARTEQLQHAYEKSVLLAVEDVENAMISFVRGQDRIGSLHQSVAAAEHSVELVTTLYKSGLTDFQNVLDMQRSLFQQQDLLAVAEGDVARSFVQLFAALGGGWEPRDESTPPPGDDVEEERATQ